LERKKFLLIDGSSLIYRAFYALPLLTTTKGEYTNAVFGFTKMLMQLLDKEKPDLAAVAMDKSGPTFRKEQYEQYKANRPKMPDELSLQFSAIREVIEGYGIPIMELAGYEGDDLIGTMSRIAEENNFEVKIVTGDQDALQLVSEQTTVLLTRKGISELEEYTLQTVKDKFGFEPIKIIDLKGLMGDKSDNIPGVPGIGEKTALKLLQEFESIENIFENIEQVKGKKLQEKLIEHKDLASISKKLATIDRYVPYQFDLERCRIGQMDREKLLNLFNRLEFRSLLDKIVPQQLELINGQENNCPSPSYQIICDLDALEQFASKLMQIKEGIAIAARFDSKHELAGIAFSWGKDKTAYLDFTSLGIQDGISLVKPLLESGEIKKFAHLYKPVHLYFLKKGIKTEGLAFDTSLAAYLLDPSRSEYRLADLALEYLNLELPVLPKTAGNRGEVSSDQAKQEIDDLVLSASVIYKLVEPMSSKLKENGLEELFNQVEIPLVKVLAGMECAGVMVDQEKLREMSEELSAQISQLESEVYELAGEHFNLNSPKQLGAILFEKLGLPVIKKTKTGYSTNAEVLDALIDRHPIIEKILEYRQLTKLKSTYLDGIAPLIDPRTKRIHTTFNQTVTTTGRLSSTEPNLQNIPIRLEVGRRIRKIFVPDKGFKLLGADYSQIELRVLAHIANDRSLIETFLNGGDIHRRTASEIFNVPLEAVTPEMRDKAKTINFGIIYGMSDFRLARDLGVSTKEASKYIKNYFARYQGVSDYIKTVIEQAKEQGYVTTLLNRRRYLPDIHSKNKNIRQFAERTAVNTPIQGSAADIIKVAMINVYNSLEERGFKTRMLLQVHDELIFEVPDDEFAEVAKIVKTEMEQAVKLKVPLIVEVKAGDDWYSMQKINVD